MSGFWHISFHTSNIICHGHGERVRIILLCQLDNFLARLFQLGPGISQWQHPLESITPDSNRVRTRALHKYLQSRG